MVRSINEPQTPAHEEIQGAVKPVITALDPVSCVVGSPDFDLRITGEDFAEHSIIVFAGHDEPTTLNGDGTLSTGVKPSLWNAPVTVEVYVRNGTLYSAADLFEFEVETQAP